MPRKPRGPKACQCGSTEVRRCGGYRIKLDRWFACDQLPHKRFKQRPASGCASCLELIDGTCQLCHSALSAQEATYNRKSYWHHGCIPEIGPDVDVSAVPDLVRRVRAGELRPCMCVVRAYAAITGLEYKHDSGRTYVLTSGWRYEKDLFSLGMDVIGSDLTPGVGCHESRCAPVHVTPAAEEEWPSLA